MAHKFNSSRRHKFDKKRYKVKNWRECNESLRQRGDVTVWLCQDMIVAWRAGRAHRWHPISNPMRDAPPVTNAVLPEIPMYQP